MKKAGPLFCCILLYFSLISQIFADLKFDHLTSQDNLSQNTVFCIAQDNNGFLWVGTEEGLNRYDGYSFRNYLCDTADPSTLTNNSITCLFVDKAGVLWIGTDGGGLNQYISQADSFRSYNISGGNSGNFTENRITAIHQGKPGFLWIGTHDCLFQFNKISKEFTNFAYILNRDRQQQECAILSLCQARDDTLWIATKHSGLIQFDLLSKTVSRHNFDYSNTGFISVVFIDSSNQLWLGSNTGRLLKYDRSKKIFINVLKLTDAKDNKTFGISVITEGPSGELWIGTHKKGLFVFFPDHNSIKNYKSNRLDLTSLSHNSIHSIYLDRSGLMWIGTDIGLNKYDERKNVFVHIKSSISSSNSLSHNQIWSVYEQNLQVIWIGTDLGLNRYNTAEGKFEVWLHDPDQSNCISGNRIYAILPQNKNERLWIGTDNGLNSFSITDNTFVHYKHDPEDKQSLSDNDVLSLLLDRNGWLWAGTKNGGLNCLKKEQEGFIKYSPDPTHHFQLSANLVFVLREDADGFIWAGTVNGLNRIDPVTGTAETWYNNPESPESISANTVISLLEDSKGNFWVGTTHGLNLFDLTSRTFKRFGTKDGLPNNMINGILEDASGFIWLSTNKGLSKFDPKTRTFTNYLDGLQGDEFNGGAYYKGSNNRLFFGGANGLNIFNPENILSNKHVPEIVFTDFFIKNKRIGIGEILQENISNTANINLSYKDSIFTLEFAALDFANPSNNRYKCKVEGINDEWIDLGKKHSFTFYNIPPGDYNFKVIASNNDNVWNEEGKSLKIIVTPPWWKTPVAYMIYGILILFIIVAGYNIRVHHLRKRHRELEELVNQRTRELSRSNKSLQEAVYEVNAINEELQETMMKLSFSNKELKEANDLKSDFLGIAAHDLKNPLQVIIGYTEMMQDSLQDDSTALRSLDRIFRSSRTMLKMITDLLESTKIEGGNFVLNKNDFDFNELVKEVVEDNRAIAAKKEQEILFSQNSSCHITADKQVIRQIVENLVSNAVKYSPREKKIWITVKPRDRFVLLKVRDEGPGLSEEDKEKLFQKFQKLSTKPTGGEVSTGLGLSISKYFVEMHGGEIWVESEPGQGSTFCVKFPLVLNGKK